MFDQQNFGHFGAPDMLPQSYGTAQSIDESGISANTSKSDEFYSTALQSTDTSVKIQGTSVFYKRPSGQALPYLRSGATDAVVKSETGIEGLVTLINRIFQKNNQEISNLSTLADSDIKNYQTSLGIVVDGIIGPETYSALEYDAKNFFNQSGLLKPPYQSGSVGTGTGLAKPKGTQTNPIGAKWYQTNTFKYSMIGLAVVGTIAILAWPRAGASEE